MSVKIPAWYREQLNSNPIDQLTDDFDPKQTIQALENEVEQTLCVLESRLCSYTERLEYANTLGVLIKSLLNWSDIQVNVIGSSYTGLGLNSDILDITVYNPDEYYPTDTLPSFLTKLCELCPAECNAKISKDNNSLFTTLIVTHPTQHTLVCSISIQNDLAITTSELIAMYTSISPVFPSLLLLVRHWAGHHPPLSSYTYTLLVIFFLQHQRVLPVLQHPQQMSLLGCKLTRFVVDDYDCSFCTDDTVTHAWTTQQQQQQASVKGHEGATTSSTSPPSLLTLMYRFFIMYNNFRSDRYVVSVRRGEFLSVFSKKHKWMKGETHFFPIEDPFISSHDVGTSCTSFISKKLWTLFDDAIEMIESGEVPFTVLHPDHKIEKQNENEQNQTDIQVNDDNKEVI